jgi:hypothetical protein
MSGLIENGHFFDHSEECLFCGNGMNETHLPCMTREEIGVWMRDYVKILKKIQALSTAVLEDLG